MLHTTYVAVFAALAATTTAFDVYSHFYTSDGTSITSTNFDLSNGGCFAVGPAAEVSFTQHDTTGTADGPYCLTSYSDGGCTHVQGRQQFSHISTEGSRYNLNSGVADARAFTWGAVDCP